MMILKINKNIKDSALIRGFIATVLGSGISKILLILLTFYCARVLTKDDFGTFSFIRNTLQLIFSLCAIGYCNLCTKFTAEAKSSDSAKSRLLLLISFSISVSFIIGLLLLLVPESIMRNIISDASLILFFRIAGFFLPWFMTQPLIEGMLRAEKKFRTIGILQVLSSLFLLFAVFISIRTYGVNGAISALLLYYVIFSLISLIALFHSIDFIAILQGAKGNIKKELPIIVNMAVPMFILSFIEVPVMWLAQVLLSKYDSFGAVGSMTAIMQIRNLVVLIPTYLFSTYTAFAAELYAKRRFDEYFQKFNKTSSLVFTYSFLLCICLVFVSPFLLGLYGKEYTTETLPFAICMLSLPFLVVVNLGKVHMTIFEHQRIMLTITVASSCMYITSIYTLLELGINSVIAFFIGQFIQILTLFICEMWCYLKDK